MCVKCYKQHKNRGVDMGMGYAIKSTELVSDCGEFEMIVIKNTN